MRTTASRRRGPLPRVLFKMSTGLPHGSAERLLNPFMKYIYSSDDAAGVAVLGIAPLDLDWNTGINGHQAVGGEHECWGDTRA